MKSDAVANVFEPAHVIVDQILEENADSREPEASRPGYNNLLRNANRVRQKQRPDDPKDMTFEVCALYFCISGELPRNLRFRKQINNKKKLTGMFCNNPTQTTCIHEFGISYHMFASCKILYLICVLRELLLYKTAVKIYGIIHVQA